MESTASPAIVQVRSSRMWFDAEHGIVRLTVAPGTLFNHDHALEVMRTYDELAAGRARPFLIDAPGYANADLESRRIWADPDMARRVTVMAIVVASPVTRVIATFFLRITRPVVRCQVFTDLTAATEWAKQHAGS